jgi:CRISPR-associated endoribonuclease Cas6
MAGGLRMDSLSPMVVSFLSALHYSHSTSKSSKVYSTVPISELAKQGLTTDVHVAFDHTYHNPIIKMVKYRDINIKGTLCPVIVEGDPRAVQFAWEVGVGNSTGIGFGAII